jgi:hypothetical protein
MKRSATISNFLILLILALSCAVPKRGPSDPTVQQTTPEPIQENSAGEPESSIEEDPFLVAEPFENEYFRVLIEANGYTVKKVTEDESILRKEDPTGDEEQFKTFKSYNDMYDFKEWVLNGRLRVRLNPHTGSIEHLSFVEGYMPKTWQSMKLIQEDCSRFQFTFPENEVLAREFIVSYEWRIQRRANLTDEEARARAIEFLKSQRRQ